MASAVPFCAPGANAKLEPCPPAGLSVYKEEVNRIRARKTGALDRAERFAYADDRLNLLDNASVGMS